MSFWGFPLPFVYDKKRSEKSIKILLTCHLSHLDCDRSIVLRVIAVNTGEWKAKRYRKKFYKTNFYVFFMLMCSTLVVFQLTPFVYLQTNCFDGDISSPLFWIPQPLISMRPLTRYTATVSWDIFVYIKPAADIQQKLTCCSELSSFAHFLWHFKRLSSAHRALKMCLLQREDRVVDKLFFFATQKNSEHKLFFSQRKTLTFLSLRTGELWSFFFRVSFCVCHKYIIFVFQFVLFESSLIHRRWLPFVHISHTWYDGLKWI